MVPRSVLAVGAGGRLSEVLAIAAKAAGVEIRTGSTVEEINVDDGKAAGVQLGDGTTIEAKTVVSAVDPRQTLLDLAGTEWLDPDFVESVNQIRAKGSVTILRLALDRLPTFKGAPDGDQELSWTIQLGNTLDTLERAFDDAKYGRVPEYPLVFARIPSLTDPTLAPEGRHVMTIWAQFTAAELSQSSWADERETFADQVVGLLDQHAPGLASSVLHRQIDTPLDLERRFGLTGGCINHVELSLDQLLYMRPMPGWFEYKTPIEGLYLCGPGVHPGGASTGLPGKCASIQILSDIA
jgi:phytoene dehydrogenase-like protein